MRTDQKTLPIHGVRLGIVAEHEIEARTGRRKVLDLNLQRPFLRPPRHNHGLASDDHRSFQPRALATVAVADKIRSFSSRVFSAKNFSNSTFAFAISSAVVEAGAGAAAKYGRQVW